MAKGKEKVVVEPVVREQEMRRHWKAAIEYVCLAVEAIEQKLVDLVQPALDLASRELRAATGYFESWRLTEGQEITTHVPDEFIVWTLGKIASFGKDIGSLWQWFATLDPMCRGAE